MKCIRYTAIVIVLIVIPEFIDTFLVGAVSHFSFLDVDSFLILLLLLCSSIICCLIFLFQILLGSMNRCVVVRLRLIQGRCLSSFLAIGYRLLSFEING